MQKEKQKILIVTAFPTHGAGSGALITTQAKSYVEDGHEVVIITGNNRTDYDKLDGVRYHTVPFTAETKEPEKIDGQCDFNYLMFTTHTESTANFWNVSLEQLEEYMNVFKKAIKEEVKEFNPNIIHTQHNWITSSIATEFKKPITLTIHGTDLMGYKKAIKKLKEVDKSIEQRKEKATEENDIVTLKNIEYLEEIYSHYKNKKQILKDIKQYMDDKKIEITKEELTDLVELFDKKTIYNLYINHAKRSAEKSNQIIVISDDQKREFIKLLPESSERVVLLENGYDPKTFYVDKDVKKEDILPAEIANYDEYILFVGKFADFKGIDSLLNSAKIYEKKMKDSGKRVATLIVGSGALEDKLKSQAEALGLQDTYFLGRKNHQEIRKLQNLAKVSLIPSRDEPFGLVVIEGTACGHKVIATNAGGIPGILNTEHKDISDKSKLYDTPLGILVSPLPDRPEVLDDKQKDELDGYMTEYMLKDEQGKEELITAMSPKLNIGENVVRNYVGSYMNTVKGISDSVIKIIDDDTNSDGERIAQYTQQNYSQDVIREKILGIFNESINQYNSINIDTEGR